MGKKVLHIILLPSKQAGCWVKKIGDDVGEIKLCIDYRKRHKSKEQKNFFHTVSKQFVLVK